MMIPEDFRLFPRKLGSVDKAMQAGLALNMTRSLGHRELRHCGVSAKPEQGEFVIDKVDNVCFNSVTIDDLFSRPQVPLLWQRQTVFGINSAQEQ